jgi:hypothetical protein
MADPELIRPTVTLREIWNQTSDPGQNITGSTPPSADKPEKPGTRLVHEVQRRYTHPAQPDANSR